MKRLLAAAVVPMFAVGAQAAPADDARIVAEATQGEFKALKGRYVDEDLDTSVTYDAEVVDLDGDGQPEVFTRRHGSMFGAAGVEVQLYVKDPRGRWRPQFGFPGDYRILVTRAGGYPDIEIAGPGTCSPVWRWNGSAYRIHKRCER